eukprot:scaffold510_cov242-Pinguiococcus_pyrenoidosus.AAC.15
MFLSFSPQEGKDLDLPADGSARALARVDPDSQSGALLLNSLLRSDAGDSSFAITTAKLGHGGALYLNGLEPATIDAGGRAVLLHGQQARFADDDLALAGKLRGAHEDIDGIGLSQTQAALGANFYEESGDVYDGPADDMGDGVDDDGESAHNSDDSEDDDDEVEEEEEEVWETMDPYDPSDTKPMVSEGGTRIVPVPWRSQAFSLPAVPKREDDLSSPTRRRRQCSAGSTVA